MNDKFFANKQLGQHFLTNQGVIQAIINDGKDAAINSILEVGPGPGALTKPLMGLGKLLTVVEKDQRFCQFWQEKLGETQVWSGDALILPLPELINALGTEKKPIWVVSNLPYNAGTPIAVRLMNIPEVLRLTLMFQKEVAHKFLLKHDMNSIGALTNIFFEVKHIINVSPGSFTPPPKVDSTVISLRRRKNPVFPLTMWSNLEIFFQILFSHRRKTVQNVLKTHFEVPKLSLAFEKAGIKANDRAETFNLEQVALLYRELHSFLP